jgi:hypothetical protein
MQNQTLQEQTVNLYHTFHQFQLLTASPTSFHFQVISPNPVLSPDDAVTPRPVLVNPSSNNDSDDFQDALDQVLLIWPEYRHLRKVTKKTVDASTFSALSDLVRRLLKQHGLLQSLAEESRASNGLRDEKERLERRIQQQLIVIEGLKHDVARLEEEMMERPSALHSNIYTPTPIIAPVQRSGSGVGDRPRVIPSRGGSFAGADRDQTARLKAALEQERAENAKLREKLVIGLFKNLALNFVY